MSLVPYKKKSLISTQNKNWKILLVGIIILSVTAPIFRSGGRTNLTAFQWIKEHTIFGSPIQYVPEEDYMAELSK